MKGFTLVAIAFCLFECSKDQFVPTVDGTVHLAGFLAISAGSSGANHAVANYWKDGASTYLTHDSVRSNVTSLYVDGSSVLIGGWKVVANSPPGPDLARRCRNRYRRSLWKSDDCIA
jgi:hypothetical protein